MSARISDAQSAEQICKVLMSTALNVFEVYLPESIIWNSSHQSDLKTRNGLICRTCINSVLLSV